jgi:hypothetical protein
VVVSAPVPVEAPQPASRSSKERNRPFTVVSLFGGRKRESPPVREGSALFLGYGRSHHTRPLMVMSPWREVAVL